MSIVVSAMVGVSGKDVAKGLDGAQALARGADWSELSLRGDPEDVAEALRSIGPKAAAVSAVVAVKGGSY